MFISSLKNEKIKKIVKIRKNSNKFDENNILIEGYREIKRALKAKVLFTEMFFCKEYIKDEENDLLFDLLSKKEINSFETPRAVFDKITYKNNPFGIIVLANFSALKISNYNFKKNPFLIIAEGIEKPGNLGALIRTVDGVGADALLLADKEVDYTNSGVIRTSTGTIFSVPLIDSTSKQIIKKMKENSINIIAADPYGKTGYTEVDYNKPTAIIVGSEANGLSNIFKENADILVQIPMKGYADSLNVNQAATIIMYEVLRQRSKK